MTFYVGQEVVAISPPDSNDDLVGIRGIVEEVYDADTSLPIYVCFKLESGDNYYWLCEESSLALAFMGPPPPPEYLILAKCKHLWNKSKWVKSHTQMAY